MSNEVLLAIPLFVFAGDAGTLAHRRELLETMGRLFGTLRGGWEFPWRWSARCRRRKGVVGATTVTMV